MFPSSPWFNTSGNSERYANQRETASHPMFQMWLNHVEQAQLDIALEESRRQYEVDREKQTGIDLSKLKEVCLELEDIQSNKECAICFNEQRCGDLGIRLSCGHCFHKACCVPWFKKNSTCPICRLQVDGSKLGKMSKREMADRHKFQEQLEQRRRAREVQLQQQIKKLRELNGADESEVSLGCSGSQFKSVEEDKKQSANGTRRHSSNFTTADINVDIDRWINQEFDLKSLPVKKLKKLVRDFSLDIKVQFLVEKDDLVSLLEKETSLETLYSLDSKELDSRLHRFGVQGSGISGTRAKAERLYCEFKERLERAFSNKQM